jgi:hypothetical protein
MSLGHQFSKNEFTSFAIFCFGSKAGNSKGSWLISRLNDACTRCVASSANAEADAPEASVAAQFLARIEKLEEMYEIGHSKRVHTTPLSTGTEDHLELQKHDDEIYRVLHPLCCRFFHKYPEK